MCQCRKCNKVFEDTQIKSKDNYIRGINTIDKVCPFCNSSNFGLMNYKEKHSIEGVYKTISFFKI